MVELVVVAVVAAEANEFLPFQFPRPPPRGVVDLDALDERCPVNPEKDELEEHRGLEDEATQRDRVNQVVAVGPVDGALRHVLAEVEKRRAGH